MTKWSRKLDRRREEWDDAKLFPRRRLLVERRIHVATKRRTTAQRFQSRERALVEKRFVRSKEAPRVDHSHPFIASRVQLQFLLFARDLGRASVIMGEQMKILFLLKML